MVGPTKAAGFHMIYGLGGKEEVTPERSQNGGGRKWLLYYYYYYCTKYSFLTLQYFFPFPRWAPGAEIKPQGAAAVLLDSWF